MLLEVLAAQCAEHFALLDGGVEVGMRDVDVSAHPPLFGAEQGAREALRALEPVHDRPDPGSIDRFAEVCSGHEIDREALALVVEQRESVPGRGRPWLCFPPVAGGK